MSVSAPYLGYFWRFLVVNKRIECQLCQRLHCHVYLVHPRGRVHLSEQKYICCSLHAQPLKGATSISYHLSVQTIQIELLSCARRGPKLQQHTDFSLKSKWHFTCPSAAAQFSHSVVSNSLWPHGLQHAKLPCPSLSPRDCSDSRPLNRWCYPTISSAVVPFSSNLQRFPISGSFPMSWLFSLGGQSTGASASTSILPMNIQGWFPLGLTGLISSQSKGLWRVFSNTTVQKHQFFSAQLF